MEREYKDAVLLRQYDENFFKQDQIYKLKQEAFKQQQEIFYKEEIVDESNTDENRTIKAVRE